MHQTKPGFTHPQAACLGMTDIFYPATHNAGERPDYTKALEVCSTCACRTECLEYAIKYNEDQGIWGGETIRSRRRMRRERRLKRILEDIR